jgi:hypothetical protein
MTLVRTQWSRHNGFGRAIPLLLIIAVFLFLQSFLPLATAVKIGADEDFELSKVILCSRGYQLYTQIWDDQPPLHTFLLTQLYMHVSSTVLMTRLLTLGFALLLLISVFVLVSKASGFLVGTLTTAFFMASPGFLELSCSCMQEIPAMAPAVTGFALLFAGPRTKWHGTEILAGICFGFALQMKLIEIAYSPLILLILTLKLQRGGFWSKEFLQCGAILAFSSIITFFLLNKVTGNPLLVQFQQSWGAHFASTKSFEYGSPDDHPFEWKVLLNNWDTSVPALFGVALLAQRLIADRFNLIPTSTLSFQKKVPQPSMLLDTNILPLAWLVLTLAVFSTHKPWWTYYYIHNALPLCWCGSIAFSSLWSYLQKRWRWQWILLSGVGALSAIGWMCARLYLQEQNIRNAPRISSCLVLREIERFSSYTKFMFSDQPIFSFHARIPMPPHLAMISLKRLWSGELTNERVTNELENVKPGLILLGIESTDVPYDELLHREYRLVYRDSSNLLYAHRSISKKAQY